MLPRPLGDSQSGSLGMEHDQRVREAARAIYDKVYPGEQWTPIPLEEAERCRTLHYRNAVDAAQQLALQFS